MLPCRLKAMLPVSAAVVAAAPPGTMTSSEGRPLRPLPWTGAAPAGLAAATVAIVAPTTRAARPAASRRKTGVRGWFRMLGIVRPRLWNVLGADLAPARPQVGRPVTGGRYRRAIRRCWQGGGAKESSCRLSSDENAASGGGGRR